MAVVAQSGIFAFGGQTGKEAVAATFYRHRATDIDLATVSDDRLGPPEVGGVPTPTIPYRAGVLATGGALINPRLESTLGWLLYGAMGAVSTTADKNAKGDTATGVYRHAFSFAGNAGYLPYMSFRKLIPGAASTGWVLDETFTDCKIVNLTLALPNDGLITSRVDVLGRKSVFDETPSTSFANAFEDYESIPIGSVEGGFLQIPGYSTGELPVVAATVTMTNAPLDIRQEKVFGDPYIEDVTVIGRAMTVDLVLKWTDPDLYQSIITGTSTGTAWTPVPFVSDFAVYARSPGNISTGVAYPYDLYVEAPSVMYQAVGGIRLAGNQALMLRLTGTALASTGEYCTISIGNASTAYAWPST